ncbi:MAG: nucleotidyltransferase substrate binding protein [Treponema sp.]|nr:nucleotidyltransferase substrate binding protein [Treponema sp.]
MIDYDKFEKSLKNLESQIRNYRNAVNRPELKEIDREAISESVIQRFEVCYDCLWKVLKRYLHETMGIPELPNSPKPLFRIAFENQLFSAIEQWLVYADARVDTSHDYSGEKAQATIDNVIVFARDAAALYQKITGKLWNENRS